MKAVAKALAARTTPLTIFFRDDDAGWAQKPLDDLLDLFARHQLPIDLAVIPAALDDVCAQRLNQWSSDHPQIGLHQHGYAHSNHESEGSRKCEFGPSRPHDRQLADVVAGRLRLTTMLERVDPIFTPPWNRCAPNTASALGDYGFVLISDDGALAKSGCQARFLPVDFDWEKHRRAGQLGSQLAQCIGQANDCLGIMLHHETMDEEARVTLGEFLAMLNVTLLVQVQPMRLWTGACL
jgi:hypothetical protein